MEQGFSVVNMICCEESSQSKSLRYSRIDDNGLRLGGLELSLSEGPNTLPFLSKRWFNYEGSKGSVSDRQKKLKLS